MPVLPLQQTSASKIAQRKGPHVMSPERNAMTLVRRRFLQLAAVATAASGATGVVLAQAPQGGPKLTQILRNDLQGQDQKVQETIVNVLEMAPGVGAPWHMHPDAQEVLFVIEGTLTVEIEGQGTRVLKAGEIALMPANIAHLARNDGSGGARALVTHSRADKEKPFVVAVKRAT
jgi:quercetin dioxygenase-like cupin family protein